jgi:DNA-binding Lrp family transcriptional regulator
VSFARNLSDIEIKVLRILYEDSRAPVTRIAKEVGVSRSTVARVIDSLVQRGVIARFTLELNQGAGFRVFARLQGRPDAVESYELLDGTYLASFTATSLMDLKRVFDRIGRPLEYMVAVQAYKPKLIPPLQLVCDKCGKQILEQPYVFRKGRRYYYACCTTCLHALRERLDKKRVV